MTGPREHQSEPSRQKGLRRDFSSAVDGGAGKPSKTRPFSIRLTDGERDTLRLAAGRKPVGQFARERLLDAAESRKAARRPNADAAMLSRILATLGRSGLPSSLASLGAAAKAGAIDMTPDLEAQLRTVCTDIQDIKRLLLQGLGLAGERGR